MIKDSYLYYIKLGIIWSKCNTMELTTEKKRIKDHFLQYWFMKREECSQSGKLTTYFQIKRNFEMEKYFESFKKRIICKFRISAHDLRIESGSMKKL
jgi:hypothetical protein